ncbi:LysR family transcriptional regulator [Amaricoccus solimangrovi]|uniref:LysR family transcriptional regulator n=1 Tax=Amaricoccus solimangrovi TaxID=2589815 RepID=A0A501WMB3_9RHOB|nr:LysR family transcriptional regulator [Amaricoccus solimangrovi]TPE46886.1 LysR family transcriptional regulator [Amaricoccus solimangrovi]
MPLRFTLRQLEYFVAVGECGSIAQAAERLRISSPSISAAIAQLEAEFGLTLFIRRHAHGLALTRGGARFLDRARELLDRAGGLHDLANDITGSVRGPLHIGCLVTFAQIILPRLRRGFVDRYPEVEFRQYECDQAELFDALRAARLDAALTYDLEIPGDLEFLPLMDLPPFALLPEDHPLAGRPSVTPAELADHPMILLDLPMSADYFLSFFRESGIAPRIVERTRDVAVMRSLVANGFGYSLANLRPLTDVAPDGNRLRFSPLVGPARTLRMGLLLAEGARNIRAIRAFVEHARGAIGADRLPNLRVPATGADAPGPG